MKILMSNYAQVLIGIVSSLRQMGHEVVTTQRSLLNLPHNELMSEIRDGKYDYIFPSFDDVSIKLIAEINEQLNLPGVSLETANLLSSKLDYYKIWQELGIRTPHINGVIKNSVKDLKNIPNFNYPCIVKPSSGTAGFGVSVVNDKIELVKHVSKCVLNKRSLWHSDFLITELVQGPVVSVVGRYVNHEVFIDLLFDLECYGRPAPLETGYYYPSLYQGKVEKELIQNLQKFFQHIKLGNSPFMLDVIVNEQGIYWIDFGARLSFNPQNLIWYGGEKDYGSKLLNSLLNNSSFKMELKHECVLFRQLPIPVGVYKNISCENAQLAAKLNLPGRITQIDNDGQVYSNGYVIIIATSLVEAESKYSEIAQSIKFI